jgi:glutaredoxin 3
MLTVYSKNNCPFCEQAKNLLTTKKIAFEVIKIDEDDVAREWLLEQRHRTVPQIYRDGKLFVEGGFQGLKKLTDEQLNEMLGETSASN